MRHNTKITRAWPGITVLPVIVACAGGPAQPSPTPGGTATLAAPVPRAPVGSTELDTLRPSLEVTNAVATGNVGTVTYRFEVSEVDSFPEGSRTLAANSIPQGNGTTMWDVGTNLTPNQVHFWRARATNGTVTSHFSRVESFKTQNKGFVSGQYVYDPLTNGETVGVRFGGHFVPGEGWQADGLTDAIDYSIPSCASCQVEFEATNFARSTSPVDIDLKWLAMGDGSTFGDFFAFRDSPWKMHLEKKSDNGAVKLIWRTGCNTGDACDHADNRREPVAWEGGQVYRFTIRWGSGALSVNIVEMPSGRTMYGRTDSYSGQSSPLNFVIELGARARSETLVGARWRNVRIGPW